MINLDVFVWSALAAFAACLLVAWAAISLEDYDDGRLLRGRLMKRAAKTRFVRMMERLHVDTSAYFSTGPLLEIEAHLLNCDECRNKTRCDGDCATRDWHDVDYSYCNNRNFIDALVSSGLALKAPVQFVELIK
jgi:hypothetical protein